ERKMIRSKEEYFYIEVCGTLQQLKFLSAIFKLYRRNSKYISDFQIISAQLKIYQRLFKYIDLPTKNAKKSNIKKA
ncbi:hypothetical protein, partial [Bacillus cereus group sp. BfR-BA-01423]|uniref:hypothetical protein n=1 Tax=Bacillus cereus group sp. BfR-BA-01423 TaxID=2920340 RepID=UPI001F5740CA